MGLGELKTWIKASIIYFIISHGLSFVISLNMCLFFGVISYWKWQDGDYPDWTFNGTYNETGEGLDLKIKKLIWKNSENILLMSLFAVPFYYLLWRISRNALTQCNEIAVWGECRKWWKCLLAFGMSFFIFTSLWIFPSILDQSENMRGDRDLNEVIGSLYVILSTMTMTNVYFLYIVFGILNDFKNDGVKSKLGLVFIQTKLSPPLINVKV